MSLEVVLAKLTRSLFRISIHMGSTTVMICFLRAFWTVFYIFKATITSSQRCLFVLIFASVPHPYITVGVLPWKGGFTQAVSSEIPS
jgi:hypothetical protein